MIDGCCRNACWLAFGWTMIHFLWMGSLVGLTAALANGWLRRSSPEIRYSAALTLFVTLALMPIALLTTLVGSAYRFSTLDQPKPTAALAEAASPDDSPAKTFATDAGSAAPAPPGVATSYSSFKGFSPAPLLERAASVLPWIWLIGSPLTLGLLSLAFVGVKRIRRECNLIEAGPHHAVCDRWAKALRVGRTVQLATHPRIAAPMLLGVLRPLIIVPAAAIGEWSPLRMEMVLLHELAHVRRWDDAVNIFQRTVEALLFFHPVVWIVSAWVRAEREYCCDALAVAQTGRPIEYAETLAKFALSGRGPALAAHMAEHPVVNRIRRVLNQERSTMQISRSFFCMIGVAVLTPCVWLAASPSETGPENDPPPNAAPKPVFAAESPLVPLEHGWQVYSIAFSADGAMFASGSHQQAPRLWDAVTGKLLAELPKRPGTNMQHGSHVAFLDGGKTLAALTDNGVDLWDVPTRTWKQTYKAGTGRLTALAVSPDGKWVAVGAGSPLGGRGGPGSILLYETATGRLVETLAHARGLEVVSLAFSPDGRTLASGTQAAGVCLWDVATRKLRKRLGPTDGPTSPVWAVAFSPDGKTVADGSHSGSVGLWNVESGALDRALWTGDEIVLSLAFSPDGGTLAFGTYGKTLRLLDLSTGRISVSRQLAGWVHALAFSPDGRTLAIGIYDRYRPILLWKSPTP